MRLLGYPGWLLPTSVLYAVIVFTYIYLKKITLIENLNLFSDFNLIKINKYINK